VGCSKVPESPAKSQVLVAAASDLVKALPELANEFEAQSGVKVVSSFGPSGSFAQQIVNGAPFDLFLSADRRFVQQLLESKNIDGKSRRVYAFGKIVLYGPSVRIGGIGELRLKDVKRIAIANPAIAPYGRAAKQALERSRVWTEVAGKVVLAENIRQAMEMADSGNVDVAITAMSLLTGQGFTEIPQQLYDSIQQEGAVVVRPKGNPQAAQKFLDYLGSPSGRRIMQKYGFSFPN